ncbi:MAG: hypothetical protein ACYC3S_03340 [Chloroflexota bacterium]
MARREYTVSLTKQGDWDRATIYEDDGSWYYCLRAADPHGEEYADEPVGPFPTSEAAEKRAREEFIPRDP